MEKDMENRDGDEELIIGKIIVGMIKKRKCTVQANCSHRDENPQRYCSTPSSQLSHIHTYTYMLRTYI